MRDALRCGVIAHMIDSDGIASLGSEPRGASTDPLTTRARARRQAVADRYTVQGYASRRNERPRMVAEVSAPWFFKQRFALFGGVYGLSFLGGFSIAGLLGIAPRAAFLSAEHPRLVALFAAALVFGGYALRVWASSFISGTIVWTQDVQLGALTVSGPYRFTRNPLYLGNLIQALGIGMLGPWPVCALLGALMLAYCLVLIAVEEPYLSLKNGTAYANYRERVARFLPLPGKVAPDGGQRGSLRDGLRSERVLGVVTVVVLAAIAYATFA